LLAAVALIILDPALSAAELARFAVSIQARKIDPAQQTLRAKQGDIVELAFSSDETVDLHLHGYDREISVRPGATSVMRIEAKIAGRFAIEAHRFGAGSGRSRHVVLLYLEIHPR